MSSPLRLLAALALATASTTCSTPPASMQALRVSGSNTVFPIAVALARQFHTDHAEVSFRITADGTARGIKWAGEGQVSGLDTPGMPNAASFPDGNTAPTMNGEAVDIGISSRDLLAEEREAYTALHVTIVALDGIAVATHLGIGVSNLTQQQLRDIYAGRVTNWSMVGGPDVPIYVVVRPAVSGTAGAWQVLVMGSDTVTSTAHEAAQNTDVPGMLAANPGSIGYLSTPTLDPTMMTPVSVNGIESTEANLRNGTYPLLRPFIFVTNTTPTMLQQRFLDFALSPPGAAIVRSQGYVPMGG